MPWTICSQLSFQVLAVIYCSDDISPCEIIAMSNLQTVVGSIANFFYLKYLHLHAPWFLACGVVVLILLLSFIVPSTGLAPCCFVMMWYSGWRLPRVRVRVSTKLACSVLTLSNVSTEKMSALSCIDFRYFKWWLASDDKRCFDSMYWSSHDWVYEKLRSSCFDSWLIQSHDIPRTKIGYIKQATEQDIKQASSA